jgi:predicted nucleic acid-binding protein
VTVFVLDNSVAMRWLLATEKRADQVYAESVLSSLTEAQALVPGLWHLEVCNVSLGAERRGDTTAGEVEAFLAHLEELPVRVDPMSSAKAFSRILGLARSYALSAYDAAYLELAIREHAPLATLDKSLRKAATRAGVPLYLR